MEKLKEEQEERLCLAGLPLRHYLMKYVFPTLTQGLIEVANLRPDDPVDFLVSRNFYQSSCHLNARLMFRRNYLGKFWPSCTLFLTQLIFLSVV